MTPPAADADLLAIVVARIGDTLLVTPALRALKEACPRGRLTVLAHPKRLAVLEHLPFVDRLGAIDPARSRLRGWMRGRRHDLAFVWGRDRPLLDYALRVSERAVAFAHPEIAVGRARVESVVPPDRALHAVRERLLLAEAAGIRAGGLRLAYVVTETERAWARARLAGAGRPLVGLQMQSFPTKAHRNWPAQSFAELAARIAQAHPMAHFVVLGDRDSRDAAALVSRRVPGKVDLAAGAASLRESAALIAALDLYVGVDTGPTHIAGALDVPMVGIYHHAYPGRNLAPLERPRLRVLEQPEAGELAVDAVLSAVEALLAESGVPA